MAEKEALIDLDKLTERELLIVCARDVRDLKKKTESLETEVHSMKDEVTALKTRSKTIGGIAGVIGGFLIALIERLIYR